MPDYGHEIRFGTFVTPLIARADEVLALASRAETLGLDLVTYQDHPYQPRFLDAWTLLSFVAARTSRIRLAANVLNLPLRQPAVLARAAASLDALSDGRVELALGAGAFWDAIEAMGGRRLAPGHAVDAVSEAIDVIRGIWDVEGTGPLVVGGEHHRLRGAKRGPAPRHEMEIWLGAVRPRMLALVGEKADGWLPSLGVVGADGLTAANAVIDASARAHGRDPREVRRLLNVGGQFSARSTGPLRGPVEQWVDELVALALEEGVSTFILASDEAADVERFAADVAPAVRAAVADHRLRAGAPDR
jgi:alkanesulfonate monooxygenase SsuD/methylene tetrahydromethanopterin reductase-like flavin-dependent oxidoreductase (luciferase family)